MGLNGEWCPNHQTYHPWHIFPVTNQEHEVRRIEALRREYQRPKPPLSPAQWAIWERIKQVWR